MYLWMKWLHIIAVISWMAGILYLFRLLIYHKERGVEVSSIHELLSLMEFRLYRYITVPAMLVAVCAGLIMISLSPVMLVSGWLKWKLAFVLLLVVVTMKAGSLVRLGARDPSLLPSGRDLRIANEIPTVLMMVIVGLVVFQSF